MPREQELICNQCNWQFKTKKDYLAEGSGFRICLANHLWFECKCGSTLKIEEGTHDWYSPKLLMSKEAAKVYEESKLLSNLPSLPSSIMRLQQTIRNANTSTTEIAAAMQQTPLLAAEVLELASNLSNGGGGFTKLEHAINYLGRSTISDLVLTATLRTLKWQTTEYQAKIFWDEAFLIGAVSEKISALYAAIPYEDLAFLAGCLCNIGKLVSALCYPQKTDRIYEMISNPKTQTTWSQAEVKCKAYEHTMLGEIALASWGIPIILKEAIVHHHHGIDKKRVRKKNQLFLSEIVAFACQISHWIRLEPHRMNENLLQEFAGFVGLNQEGLNAFVQTLSQKLN